MTARTNLGTIADVRDGTHDSPKRSDSGHPLVTSKHIKNGKIELDSTYLISEADFEDISRRSKVSKWDILFSMIGTVGEIALVREDPNFAIKNIGLIKTNDETLGKYLYYYLISPRGRERITSYLTGSTQKFIGLGQLRSFPVEVPDVEDLTRIVSILSPYDDLIESNEKRIKILETMAQSLYEEWFVKFKFPGHEKVKMVNLSTEFGFIPERWQFKKLKEIANTVTGKTPPTGNPEYFGGDVMFIKTPDLHGNIFIIKTGQTLSQIGAQSQHAKTLPPRSIVVSCIGTLGVVSITSTYAQTNQQINALLPNDQDDYCFLYQFAKGIKPLLEGLGSNGATMRNVNKEKFENIACLYPPSQLRKKFYMKVSNIFEEILVLQRQVSVLTQTRDTLIPSLIK